jgi:hypothetical protein
MTGGSDVDGGAWRIATAGTQVKIASHYNFRRSQPIFSG